MTGSAFRTVAPVLAVCAAFAVQPSALPTRSLKTGRCADVRHKKFDRSPAQRVRSKEEMQRNGRDLPLAAGRGIWSLHRRSGEGRTKPRCRARSAAVTTARGAGSLGFSRRGCCRRENNPIGVRKAKSPAVSGKTAGLHTEIGGILAWQATRSSFRSG